MFKTITTYLDACKLENVLWKRFEKLEKATERAWERYNATFDKEDAAFDAWTEAWTRGEDYTALKQIWEDLKAKEEALKELWDKTYNERESMYRLFKEAGKLRASLA